MLNIKRGKVDRHFDYLPNSKLYGLHLWKWKQNQYFNFHVCFFTSLYWIWIKEILNVVSKSGFVIVEFLLAEIYVVKSTYYLCMYYSICYSYMQTFLSRIFAECFDYYSVKSTNSPGQDSLPKYLWNCNKEIKYLPTIHLCW